VVISYAKFNDLAVFTLDEFKGLWLQIQINGLTNIVEYFFSTFRFMIIPVSKAKEQRKNPKRGDLGGCYLFVVPKSSVVY